jgi:hypothetical protein
MTDADLAEIERRCLAATPGPWRSLVEGRDHTSGDSMVGVGGARGEDMYVTIGGHPASAADQDFIAGARQDVPRLIAEIRRLRAGQR